MLIVWRTIIVTEVGTKTAIIRMKATVKTMPMM